MPSLGVPSFHGVFPRLPFPLSIPLVPVGAGIHDFCLELFWAPGVGQSQCEKCAGYFEERSETCVHCEESRGFGREQQGLSLEAAALGSVAWVSLDWLLPVSVFPSVRNSWEVTTK